MKIYLAGAISGGGRFAIGLKTVSDALENMGHEVLSKGFVVNLSLIDQARDRDDSKIVGRDLTLIRDSDCFIAEVSGPSHGVGYEHRFAEEENKPILFLRHRNSEKERKSAFLEGTGYPGLMFSHYDENDISKVLAGFFDEFFGEDIEGKVGKERGK